MPLFHCDAKLLASDNFALPNAKDSTFALPNAKNTNMLVSLAFGDANFSRLSGINVALRPKRKFLALAMYISFFVCRFHLRWVAITNPISSGIWALVSTLIFCIATLFECLISQSLMTYFNNIDKRHVFAMLILASSEA